MSYTPSAPASGADGVAYSSYTNCDWSGLSGYRLNGIRVLSAVALSDSVPVAPAPAKLLVDTLGFQSLSPDVRQIFPVGDGLVGTGRGAQQIFHLPDATTRLILGFLDSFTGAAPGWYGDNSGQIDATIEVLGGLLAVGDIPANELRITGRMRTADGGVALSFVAPAGGPVTGQVFDVAGRLQLDDQVCAAGGPGQFVWHARDAAGSAVRPGVFLARLTQGARTATARVVVLR